MKRFVFVRVACLPQRSPSHQVESWPAGAGTIPRNVTFNRVTRQSARRTCFVLRLLDPRILEFRDEVTYSRLLKESYPEEVLDRKDRRIDFLCSNALGEILYVIEIKRSLFTIDAKALEQAYEYGVFLQEKYAGEKTSFSKVVCFVVGGQKSSNPIF